jgi:hypothetical protein
VVKAYPLAHDGQRMSGPSCTASPRAARPAATRGRPRARGAVRVLARALCCALLSAAAACGSERGETLEVNARDAGAEPGDGGGAGDPSSPRPADGPSLPPADARVVLPFRGDTARYTIDVDADPGVLDVQLSMDTTASMGPEIHELQRDLERKLVPELRKRVPSVNFGVSKFADFPLRPFGAAEGAGPPDAPFVLLVPITADVSRVATAVAALDQPLGNGGDLPEAGAEALWQIATGAGYSAAGTRWIEAFDPRGARASGAIGGVGFREGALRVVLHVTDAPSHTPADYAPELPGTHDMTEAGEALRDIGAHLVAIVAGTCDAESSMDCDQEQHRATRAELEQLAIATGALGAAPVGDACPHGIGGEDVASRDGVCPLVFDVDGQGRGLTDTSIDAIADLVDGIRYEAVTGQASADPLGFVAAVSPVEGSGDDAPELADLVPKDVPDGSDDSFVHVHARTKLRFAVALQNQVIAPTDVDQSFRVTVQITGDGLILNETTLRVVVPKGDTLAPSASDEDDDAGA